MFINELKLCDTSGQDENLRISHYKYMYFGDFLSKQPKSMNLTHDDDGNIGHCVI